MKNNKVSSITDLQLKTKLYKLLFKTLTLDDIQEFFMLSNYISIDFPDKMADYLWTIFSHIGGFCE